MEIRFGDEYKLVPLGEGWELLEWSDGGTEVVSGKYKGNITQPGWKRMNAGNGCYPHDLKHAVQLIADKSMKGKVGEFSLRTALNDIAKYMNELDVIAERYEEALYG